MGGGRQGPTPRQPAWTPARPRGYSKRADPYPRGADLSVMTGLANLNLIRFLDFYFMLMFLVGTLRRVGQYREVGRLVLTGPGRWPRLLELVHRHRTIFLTWATVLPGLLALALSVVQLIASHDIWPQANLTAGQLSELWVAGALVAPLGLLMLAVDVYSAVAVG